jgi:putative endonuclease
VREYWVYILASIRRVLYIGVTNDLQRRIFEHKCHLVPGFTSKYGIDELVYFESTNDVHEALAREKQLKGWLRKKKVALIESESKVGRPFSRMVRYWSADSVGNTTSRRITSPSILCQCHPEPAKDPNV